MDLDLDILHQLPSTASQKRGRNKAMFGDDDDVEEELAALKNDMVVSMTPYDLLIPCPDIHAR